jgi:hypothetical protein
VEEVARTGCAQLYAEKEPHSPWSSHLLTQVGGYIL